MKKINKIEPVFSVLTEKKKVAVYARVSRNTERLAHSVSAQVSYYSTLIRSNPKWEYAGVYADCGTTGTLISKRSEFQRMLSDCEAGKIDIILTKSISRFARNTVDLLEAVRHLKALGIEVRFEKEHINSLSEDGELMLSLLASFAQEESRSISENVKWGIRKRFESAEIGAANKHIFGYQYDEKEKKYIVIPKEAEVVRWMFDMYRKGISLRNIAKAMNESGARTVRGCLFTECAVKLMIDNEIYAGDIRRQKYFVEDPITKKKVLNRGQLPQYYIENCHEAILDRRTWAEIQEEKKRREAGKNPIYPFTGKIKCGICGHSFTRKKGSVKGKIYVDWICRAKKEPGITCTSRNFTDFQLRQISADIMGLEEFDEAEFKRQIEKMVVMKDGSMEYFFKGGGVKRWREE